MKYNVNFYAGNYTDRQNSANRDGAALFVVQHFNAATSPAADYGVVIIDPRASEQTEQMAQFYIDRIAATLAQPKFAGVGVKRGGFGGRGDGQLMFARMPALLLEPLFCSNPGNAAQLRSEAGRAWLAQAIVDTVCAFIPDGALIAFSVGHKGKPAPHDNDRGAVIIGAPPLNEADAAEMVLQLAAEVLRGEKQC